MKKYISLLLFVVLLCACETTQEYQHVDLPTRPKIQPTIKKRLTFINQIVAGMTEQEVLGIMGESVNVGYVKSDFLDGAYDSIPLQQPHKQEELVVENITYKIIYFYTHVSKPDGMISDDELTPLVFKDNALVGKGWDDLFELKK